MHPVLFQLGELKIYSYPFVMGAAWALSFHLGQYYLGLRKRVGHSYIPLFIGVFLSAWLGAKALFLLNSSQGEFLTVATNSNFWLGGGFVFYGGLIGSVIFLSLYSLITKKFNFSDSHLLIPTLAICHSIGRVGCLLAGCCFGKETTLPFSIHLHGILRHPVQIYESVGLFILFLILHKQVVTGKRPSTTIFTYIGGYSLVRFALEFLRGDKIRGVYTIGISSSQLISIAMLLVVIIGYFAIRLREENDKV